MILAFLDLETTGLNPQTDSIIEAATILYSVEYKTVLQQYSTLLPVVENPAYNINKISADASTILGGSINAIYKLLEKADYILIHNKKFDTGFLGNLPKPVICTMNEVRFPKSDSKKLTEIALDHGVPVLKAHRAISDCMLLVDIFNTYSPGEILEIIEKALKPKILYISLEEKPGTLSKKAGFKWKSIVDGYWAKWMHPEEIETLPFKVVEYME